MPLETLKEDKRDDDNATPHNESDIGAPNTQKAAAADSSQAALLQQHKLSLNYYAPTKRHGSTEKISNVFGDLSRRSK